MKGVSVEFEFANFTVYIVAVRSSGDMLKTIDTISLLIAVDTFMKTAISREIRKIPLVI